MSKKRVLIGSPIHQRPMILTEFLQSLKDIEQETIEVDYIFIDDNEIEESTQLLAKFKQDVNHVIIVESDYIDQYNCNDETHEWNEQLIWKVAHFKNRMIQTAIERNYDYLFLIDSDLVIHPKTIEHLKKNEKEIISTIFWTKWQPDLPALPQVWISDHYTLFHKNRNENVTDEEINKRQHQFIQQLKKSGIYEVGGLGACTLISRKAMVVGVNFSEIKNISFWGEDRHFCIRAVALGFSLYVDTHYPAYHIYRPSDLAGVEAFKEKNKNNEISLIKAKNSKLTLSMVIKNEADRYLRVVLDELKHYIDEAVIIDDGSTDDSVQICYEVLEEIPIYLVQNRLSKFSNEIDLRKQQWEETIKTNPDWILNLDADECFEKKFRTEITKLINQAEIDVYNFRLYDFWDENHYREDQYWCAHFTYRPFLIRYKEDIEYKWKETAQHCGRFPINIIDLPSATSSLRLKHFGWSKPRDRLVKYLRYLSLDPNGQYGWKEQYQSILDENPRLIKWEEGFLEELSSCTTSRFIIESDVNTDELIFTLPKTWWSRRYEYKWASLFAEPKDIVLDAACGISHPFKFYLLDQCKEVYACDLDERILSKEAIVNDIKNDFGMEAADQLPEKYFRNIHFQKANLTELPFEDKKFDKIFCISVLEHLGFESMKKSLREFNRTLKDEGKIILTFDYPTIHLDDFRKALNESGLTFAGDASFELPDNAIFSDAYQLYSFRAVLKKN